MTIEHRLAMLNPVLPCEISMLEVESGFSGVKSVFLSSFLALQWHEGV
jgi:hypothetical protein